MAADLQDDGARLVIRDDRGHVRAAPLRQRQQSFALPKISPDGTRVGWLAEMPNVATSYPVAQSVVLMDTRGRLRVLQGELGLFGWCFTRDSSAVV